MPRSIDWSILQLICFQCFVQFPAQRGRRLWRIELAGRAKGSASAGKEKAELSPHQTRPMRKSPTLRQVWSMRAPTLRASWAAIRAGRCLPAKLLSLALSASVQGRKMAWACNYSSAKRTLRYNRENLESSHRRRRIALCALPPRLRPSQKPAWPGSLWDAILAKSRRFSSVNSQSVPEITYRSDDIHAGLATPFPKCRRIGGKLGFVERF